jgi:hypothetical protein
LVRAFFGFLIEFPGFRTIDYQIPNFLPRQPVLWVSVKGSRRRNNDVENHIPGILGNSLY